MVTYILGYSDFDVLLENGEGESGIGSKINSDAHLKKKQFYFFAPFPLRLASKFAKSADKTQKILFSSKN